MSITVKMNIDKVIAGIKRKNGIIRQRAQSGMVKGMRFYEAKFVKEQLSGRKSASFGHNRITGTLARSWRTTVKDAGRDFVVTLATSTIYARTHQFGDPKRNIPKRLRILEDFRESGLSLITESISDELRKFIR